MDDMASSRDSKLVGQLGRLFDRGTVAGLPEGQILERYASHRDGAAFEALVARHGSTVLGVYSTVTPRPERRRGCLPGHLRHPGPQGEQAPRSGGARPLASRCGVPGRLSGEGRCRAPVASAEDLLDEQAIAHAPAPDPGRLGMISGGAPRRRDPPACPTSTDCPSSFASWRDEPTTRPPTSFAGRLAWSEDGWRKPEPGSGTA